MLIGIISWGNIKTLFLFKLSSFSLVSFHELLSFEKVSCVLCSLSILFYYAFFLVFSFIIIRPNINKWNAIQDFMIFAHKLARALSFEYFLSILYTFSILILIFYFTTVILIQNSIKPLYNLCFFSKFSLKCLSNFCLSAIITLIFPFCSLYMCSKSLKISIISHFFFFFGWMGFFSKNIVTHTVSHL